MATHKPPALTLLSQHPEMLAISKEINELQAALTKGQNRRHDLALLLNEPMSQNDRLAGQVEAALEFAAGGQVRRSATLESYGEEDLVLREQGEALRGAIQQKRNEMYVIEARLTAETGRGLQGQHDELRARYVAKVRELDAIAMEERTLLGGLAKLGYHWSPRNRAHWYLLGFLDEVGSQISMFVREHA